MRAAERYGTGRHRRGSAQRPWTRVRWDARERAAAEALNTIEPGWLVMYRLWARKFYAISAWPLPDWDGVEAATVVGLRARMRQAELSIDRPARTGVWEEGGSGGK